MASSTTSTRCGWSRCWSATSVGLNLTGAGPRRDRPPHRPGQAGHAGGAGSSAWSTASPTSTTTSTTPCRAGILPPRGPARRRDRAARPDRLDPHRHAWSRTSSSTRETPATSSSPRRSGWRCCACGSSCSTRVYLGDDGAPEHVRVEHTMTGLFDHYLAHPRRSWRATRTPTSVQRVTDYIAGMTDRFCIARLHRPGDPRGGAASRWPGSPPRASTPSVTPPTWRRRSAAIRI